MKGTTEYYLLDKETNNRIRKGWTTYQGAWRFRENTISNALLLTGLATQENKIIKARTRYTIIERTTV